MTALGPRAWLPLPSGPESALNVTLRNERSVPSKSAAPPFGAGRASSVLVN